MCEYELWVGGQKNKQTNKQTHTDTHTDRHTHINTMTRPGLGTGLSENMTG